MVDLADTSTPPDRVAIVIPARMGSTRFPGKPLTALRGHSGHAKPLIERTWLAASRVESVDAIVVATDNRQIRDVAAAFGADVVLTSPDCINGTERCWDAVLAAGIAADIVINLQGDAPLTQSEAVEALIAAMRADPRVPVATVMTRCSPAQFCRMRAERDAGKVGGTTVVTDQSLNALYFSRQTLPYGPPGSHHPVFLHIGLYAYRRNALEAYARMPMSELERLEGLEQLRFLHAGVPIRMVEIAEPTGGLQEVNNPWDVPLVEAALAERGLE